MKVPQNVWRVMENHEHPSTNGFGGTPISKKKLYIFGQLVQKMNELDDICRIQHFHHQFLGDFALTSLWTKHIFSGFQLGQPTGNPRKTIGKPWENDGFSIPSVDTVTTPALRTFSTSRRQSTGSSHSSETLRSGKVRKGPSL